VKIHGTSPEGERRYSPARLPRLHPDGEAKMELFDYIEVFYNQRRRHSSVGRISPAAFERKMTHAA
jgi:transposase InsO family protein